MPFDKKREDGSVAVEYALLLLVIFMVIITSVSDFGGALNLLFENAVTAF